jgi:hypothetical protein
MNYRNNNVKKAQLFDITGRMVKDINVNSSTIDITSFPSGIYMLKLDFKSSSIINKIIKN